MKNKSLLFAAVLSLGLSLVSLSPVVADTDTTLDPVSASFDDSGKTFNVKVGQEFDVVLPDGIEDSRPWTFSFTAPGFFKENGWSSYIVEEHSDVAHPDVVSNSSPYLRINNFLATAKGSTVLIISKTLKDNTQVNAVFVINVL